MPIFNSTTALSANSLPFSQKPRCFTEAIAILTLFSLCLQSQAVPECRHSLQRASENMERENTKVWKAEPQCFLHSGKLHPARHTREDQEVFKRWELHDVVLNCSVCVASQTRSRHSAKSDLWPLLKTNLSAEDCVYSDCHTFRPQLLFPAVSLCR